MDSIQRPNVISQINCIFCHWHRVKDNAKGAKHWDAVATATELIEHLDTAHFTAMAQFQGLVYQHSLLRMLEEEVGE